MRLGPVVAVLTPMMADILELSDWSMTSNQTSSDSHYQRGSANKLSPRMYHRDEIVGTVAMHFVEAEGTKEKPTTAMPVTSDGQYALLAPFQTTKTSARARTFSQFAISIRSSSPNNRQYVDKKEVTCPSLGDRRRPDQLGFSILFHTPINLVVATKLGCLTSLSDVRHSLAASTQVLTLSPFKGLVGERLLPQI